MKSSFGLAEAVDCGDRVRRANLIQTTLTTLLNDVAATADEIVPVLDDHHDIDAPDVQAEMGFLLDNLPPRLHLVIVTRADPALPLARLRARGQLVEARAADLRFTADEAAALSSTKPLCTACCKKCATSG